MIALLLILIPLIGGLVSFFLKENRAVRIWALVVSLAMLGVTIAGTSMIKGAKHIRYSISWL